MEGSDESASLYVPRLAVKIEYCWIRLLGREAIHLVKCLGRQ